MRTLLSYYDPERWLREERRESLLLGAVIGRLDHLPRVGVLGEVMRIEEQRFNRIVSMRLRELRVAGGLSQADMARALGVTQQQYQKYERGTNRLSAGKLGLAAEALGVDPGAFFKAGEQP